MNPYDLSRAAQLKRAAHTEQDRRDAMLTEEERDARDRLVERLPVGSGEFLRVWDQLATARALLLEWHRSDTLTDAERDDLTLRAAEYLHECGQVGGDYE